VEKINIAIDGPSGSGKSTVAKELAKILNISYLDTGAMYRGIGYYLDKMGVDCEDNGAVVDKLNEITMDIVYDGDIQKVIVNETDVTPYIRENNVSRLAKIVSTIKEVRLKLVDIQRDIASKKSIILDGRDIGSYVLPEADYKFYLTASIDARAKRRYLEIKDKQDVTLEKVKVDMMARDESDSTRAFAPLVVPKGAFVLDTTNLSIAEVIEVILGKIKRS
jgi:cytidylate kinase